MENELVKWVNYERERLGISFRDIAESANHTISHTHISDTLNYKTPMSEKFAFAMSVAFKLPIWEAFYMAGLLSDKPKYQAELLIKFDKLPPDDQKRIIDQVDFLIYRNKKEA